MPELPSVFTVVILKVICQSQSDDCRSIVRVARVAVRLSLQFTFAFLYQLVISVRISLCEDVG